MSVNERWYVPMIGVVSFCANMSEVNKNNTILTPFTKKINIFYLLLTKLIYKGETTRIKDKIWLIILNNAHKQN